MNISSAPLEGAASVAAHIGIIGLGRFGKLLSQVLEADHQLACYDPGIESIASTEHLKEACRAGVVFLCVPIVAFEACLREVAPLLKPGTLVVDVLSVKEYALQTMRELLPASVGILPTHPMFGPDAAKAGLEGLPFVLCPCDRTPDISLWSLRSYLERKQLRVVEMTCEEHDRITARSLCLTQLLGRALDRMEVTPSPIDTATFANLLKMRQMAVNDSWELFGGLQRYNRFAGPMRQDLLATLEELERHLKRM